MFEINFFAIIGTACLIGFTPGPGNLTVAGTAMSRGRQHGLALGYGITTGSCVWAVLSGLGMATLLQTHQWLFEALKYAGAIYLLWLGWRSAKAAATPNKDVQLRDLGDVSLLWAWSRGTLIHLTNPKALLYWGSIFAIGVKPEASHDAIYGVIALSLFMNIFVVTSWALVFSNAKVMQSYRQSRRWIEGVFAGMYGLAAALVVTR